MILGSLLSLIILGIELLTLSMYLLTKCFGGSANVYSGNSLFFTMLYTSFRLRMSCLKPRASIFLPSKFLLCVM